MKKSEALAKQAKTIEEVEQDDRGSEIRKIAEYFKASELVADDRDYAADEIRKYIPFGSYLRDLEVIYQTESAATEQAKPLDYPPDAA